MSRRHDLRNIKDHLTYTASELATTLNVARSTVSHWTTDGLKPIERKRPYLYAAYDIKAYIESIAKPRQPLELGEIFCVACKVGRLPKENGAIYRPRSVNSGDLIGVCPVCNRDMFRRTKLADIIGRKFAQLDVRFEDATAPILRDRAAS